MKTVRLIGFIILCEFAGVLGSLFTTPKISGWYTALQKPFFSPPNWIFAPVWATLFALMGVSLYLIWESKNKEKRFALSLFATQLILNVLWTYIFFGLQFPALAFMEILLLWFVILWCLLDFYSINKTSAWLLLPYILWVSFAAILNFYIWTLN